MKKSLSVHSFQSCERVKFHSDRTGKHPLGRGLSLSALGLLCSLSGPGTILAQNYQGIDLTPAGYTSARLSGTSLGLQVGGVQYSTGVPHAVLMEGNALTSIDLHPVNYYYSMAMCTDGIQQGGWAYALTGGIHAIVWNGSSSSFADLNPSGYNFSYCLGVDHGDQVGYAQQQSYFVTASHAMLWRGSAASAIDLHPAWGYPFSRAMGCRGGEQVGYVSTLAYPDGDSAGYHATSRAVKWNGSALSAVSLHPVGFDASEAVCTSGSNQGGWAYLGTAANRLQAMMWSGTAESAVSLHPPGFTDSKVLAISDNIQVGEGWIGYAGVNTSERHALAWFGSADTVVDLNAYLPAGYLNAVATGVDDQGNVVGYAYNGSSFGRKLKAR